jgi:predicted nuclease of restriction endonuclease-like (RecB) superfamily
MEFKFNHMSKEISLFKDLAQIIEEGKRQAVTQVNSVLTLTYWHVGKKINEHILKNERAEYGEKVVANTSRALEKQYGRSYTLRNVRRMMQFAEVFPDFKIVTSLMTQLSWTHFIELFPLKSAEQRLFYAEKIASERWTVRETNYQIGRKAYERKEIANLQAHSELQEIQNTFKDPYFLDFLGLKDGYLENDIESAIIKELELFILELGKGFSFIERQKRIILDGKDFYLDLLFFHRKLKRLVAIDLKLGEFEPSHKGQMELYLKWLNKYEKHEGEDTPIGLILCAGKSNEQIELLEMHKDGIMVAEYWTELPSKKELEQKLHSLLIEARARIENKKLLEE